MARTVRCAGLVRVNGSRGTKVKIAGLVRWIC